MNEERWNCTKYVEEHPRELGGVRLEFEPERRSDPSGSSDWPTPQPLGPELLPVEAFNPEFVPASFRSWIEDVAERMQVPLDMPAAVAVVTAAGALNRRALIFPKRKDTGWTVVPNLWGGIVSPPGHLKTPTIEALTRPLVKTEALWRQEYESELAAYKDKEQQEKLKNQAWGEQFKQAYKKKQQLPSFTRDHCCPVKS